MMLFPGAWSMLHKTARRSSADGRRLGRVSMDHSPKIVFSRSLGPLELFDDDNFCRGLISHGLGCRRSRYGLPMIVPIESRSCAIGAAVGVVDRFFGYKK